MLNMAKKIDHHLLLWLTRCGIALLSTASMMASAQTPIWSEEFNYTSVPDSEVWSYDLGSGGWGNQELQNYTSDSDNVWVNGSNLVITAIRSGNSFTSARVKTQDKLTFKYGTIEARIQTPDLANGLWPAFWTLGNNYSSVGWPACGEIDIMEMGHADAISANPSAVNQRVGSHAHWDNNGSYAGYGLYKDMPSDIDGTFVTYRMEWTPTSVKTYINGQWIWTMTTSAIPEFNEPHFFILNLAVGGNYTGILTAGGITSLASGESAEYKVDWIRIYDNGYTQLGGTSTLDSTPYYGTPMAIPGIIQVEDYDNGGQSVAYNDTGAANNGSSYRLSEGVDIEACTDTGGGYNVGWTEAGEWMKYAVDVAAAGDYIMTARVARGTGGAGAFHIEVDDVNVTGTITVNDTLGWQNWVDKTSVVSLAAGEQVVKIVFESGEININYLDFERVTPLPFSLTSSVAGGSIEISFSTQVGFSYEVTYKSSLTNESWNTIETVVGDGNTNTVSYPTSEPARFYNVMIP